MTRVGEQRDAYRVLLGGGRGNQKERDVSQNLGVGGRIILKCILKRQAAKAWAGLILFRIGTGGGRL